MGVAGDNVTVFNTLLADSLSIDGRGSDARRPQAHDPVPSKLQYSHHSAFTLLESISMLNVIIDDVESHVVSIKQHKQQLCTTFGRRGHP
jgi:hypothetical protein